MTILATAVAGVLALALTGCSPSDDESPMPTRTAAPILPAHPPLPSMEPGTSTSMARRMPQPTPGPGRPSPEPSDDECGADELGQYLNVLPTSEVLTKVRLAVGHDRIRLIAPGDAVTMDFRPDRLNIETGDDGRIKLFRCG